MVSGTQASSSSKSWLTVARMPMGSQVSTRREPGVPRGSTKLPRRGLSSSVTASTLIHASNGPPVT
jgi:hypothetical protein